MPTQHSTAERSRCGGAPKRSTCTHSQQLPCGTGLLQCLAQLTRGRSQHALQLHRKRWPGMSWSCIACPWHQAAAGAAVPKRYATGTPTLLLCWRVSGLDMRAACPCCLLRACSTMFLVGPVKQVGRSTMQPGQLSWQYTSGGFIAPRLCQTAAAMLRGWLSSTLAVRLRRATAGAARCSCAAADRAHT